LQHICSISKYYIPYCNRGSCLDYSSDTLSRINAAFQIAEQIQINEVGTLEGGKITYNWRCKIELIRIEYFTPPNIQFSIDHFFGFKAI
jgi:hypothetical protein